MIKKIFIIILVLVPIFYLNAQNVGINEANPDPSSALEISSTNTGLLIPRIALTGTTSASPVTAPATSLLVYNTATVSDVVPGYYYWNGTVWVALSVGSNNVEGSGTTDYVARWTPDGSTLGIGKIQDNGSTVGINASPNASYNLYNNGSFFNQGQFYTNINSQSYPNTNAGLSIQWNYNGGYRDVSLWNTYTNASITDEAFVFRQMTGAGSHNDIMMLMAQGNVGIGTVPISEPPLSKLEISVSDYAGIEWDALRLENKREQSGSGYGVGIKFHNTPDDRTANNQVNRWAGIGGISEADWGQSVGLVFYTNSNSSAPTEKMRITNDGKVGINTSLPGAYQTKIVGANGNNGLYVYKNESAAGTSLYGVNAYARNSSATATATHALFAFAESSSGDTYGVRGLTEQSGSGYFYSVAGEAWNWNRTSLNTEGYLGYFEGNSGTKGYSGFIGVLGHVADNNGFSDAYPSYAGYFHNNMSSSDNTKDKYGVFSEVDAQSFSANDGTASWGLYSSATNTESIYGIVGEAKLTNWSSNDLMTGVNGILSWGGNTYAEGYLAYHDSDNDFTGEDALVGVAGRVTNLYTNNGKNSMAGYFENAYTGTSGNKTSDSYGLYAISKGSGIAGSVNYGIYATASGAETNYAAYLDGDVVVGSNGTAIKNMIKRDISVNPPSIAAYAQADVVIAFPNAATGSTVMLSPSNNSHNGLMVCFAYVSSSGNITIRFMNGTGGTIDGASIIYHITIIE